MNHTKIITLALLTVSMATILSISYVHAQTLTFSSSNYAAPNPIPSYGSDNLISSGSTQPSFDYSNQTQSKASLISHQRLENAHQILTNMILKHNRTEVPIFATYINQQNSTLIVGISDDATLPVSAYHEELKTIVGDVPMKIRFGHFITQSCTSQYTTCSPLMGGIELGTNSGPTLSFGTLTLPLTNPSGVQGFIMSGHVAFFQTGLSVGQPSQLPVVGTVLSNPPAGGTRTSDSAFVQASSGILLTQQIFGPPYNVIGEIPSSQTPYQTPVNMVGEGSGSSVQSGYILGTGLTVNEQNPNLVLTNQVAANYHSQSGDSGAPVFSSPDAFNNVYFYGIHVGTICFGGTGDNCTGGSFEPVYSPWEGISHDLFCVPPSSTDWIVTSSCTLSNSASTSYNVIINSGAVLTIPNGITLNINFAQKHLLVQSGGGVLIQSGGKII